MIDNASFSIDKPIFDYTSFRLKNLVYRRYSKFFHRKKKKKKNADQKTWIIDFRLGEHLACHYMWHITQFQITGFYRFGSVWFGMVTVLLTVWLWVFCRVLFTGNLKYERNPSVFVKQIIRDLVPSYCYTYRQLTCRNLEVNSVSYVSQQRVSPDYPCLRFSITVVY